MRDFWQMQLREEIKPDGGEGGAPVPQPKPNDTTPAPKVDPTPQAAGKEFDDFGYEIKANPAGEKKPEDKITKEPEPKEPPVKIEDVTGYEKEIKASPAAPEPPVVEPPAPADLGYDPKDLKVEGLKPEEAKQHKDFAIAQKLSKDQAQAYIDQRKAEAKQFGDAQVEAKKIFDKQVVDMKAGWQKELKTDPTFGGDKFAANVQRANQVLTEFLPNLKNKLTENGSMTPPWVMRDLAKLADVLYATPKMRQGEPIVPRVEEDVTEDPHAFLKDLYPNQ